MVFILRAAPSKKEGRILNAFPQGCLLSQSQTGEVYTSNLSLQSLLNPANDNSLEQSGGEAPSAH